MLVHLAVGAAEGAPTIATAYGRQRGADRWLTAVLLPAEAH